MRVRTLCASMLVLGMLALAANRAWALGFILGQTKEELGLKYEVSVQDHGTGRVTVVLTLADEGRLKPVDAVELKVPGPEEKDGGRFMDLSVSLDTERSDDGKRVARVHLRKEWAERAQLWLTTSSLEGDAGDGPGGLRTRYHHVIPLAEYVQHAQAAGAKPATAPATQPAPPASPASKRETE